MHYLARFTLILSLVGATSAASCSSDTPLTSVTGQTGTHASGRISVAASADWSTDVPYSGSTKTISDLGQGNYAFDLPEISGPGGQLFNWSSATFGGTASWYEEDDTPSTVQIPGTLDYRPCVNQDSLIESFSTAAVGAQPGSVELELLTGRQYRLTINAYGTGATNGTHILNTNCNGNGQFVRTSSSTGGGSAIFSQYFSSSTLGASGYRPYVTGTIPAGSNRVNGVLQWVDSLDVIGWSGLRVPVNVVLTWDITIQ